MTLFQKIWHDIRAGENIDQYLTIIVAIILTLLNLLGIYTQSSLAPFILAVLSLLAINSLVSRFKIDELLKGKTGASNILLRNEYPSSYKTDFENADEMWLIGVSLHRTIKTNYPILEKKLRRGQLLRVLLVRPQGAGIQMAVTRNYTHRRVDTKSNDILFVLELLCSLREIAPSNIYIRTIDFPLSYGATVVNPDTVDGKLYIEHYSFRVSADSIPRYVLKVSDGQWYAFYKREIEALWLAGEDWECKNIDEG